MWDFIERFHATKEFPPNLDALFGTPDWREPMSLPNWSDRKRGLFDLYKRQLKACTSGRTHVVHFELYEGSKLVYAIFHATRNALGCDRMKAAIWKVAPFDGMAFRPGEEGSVSLFADDRTHLQAELKKQFGDGEWHDLEDLEGWIMSDATTYHQSHLRSALTNVENANELEHRPEPGKKRRGRTFPSGSQVRLIR